MIDLKIVTYNLRTLYDTYDGVNAFIHRAGMILDKISEEQPHVICFQEMGEQIRPFLKKYLVDYDIVGHGRRADFSGEGLGIAYRKDCMELFGLEQFWLSPTPQVPGSRYAIQSQYPRICIYAVLKHKDMKIPIRLYDVHLDHESDEARILGIRQILEHVTKENQIMAYPTFIMGDFNARPDSKTIAYCNDHRTYPVVDLTVDIGATYHDFGGTGKTVYSRGWKIDYIYTDPETAQKTKKVYKWEDNKNGIYLSDHYPVCCKVRFED